MIRKSGNRFSEKILHYQSVSALIDSSEAILPQAQSLLARQIDGKFTVADTRRKIFRVAGRRFLAVC
jgi:hypothetical protein